MRGAFAAAGVTVVLGAGALAAAGAASPEPRAGAAANELSLSAPDRHLWLGQRARLRGRLSGPRSARREVALEADPFPFGEFRRVARTRTGAEGRFRFRHRPRRNTRYRAVAATEPAVSSRALTVFADVPGGTLWFIYNGNRAAIRVYLDVPRYARLPGPRAHIYVFHKRRPRGRHVGSARFRRAKGRRFVATVRFRMSGLGPRHFSGFCVRELEQDGWGRHRRIDRICGRERLLKRAF